LSYLFFLQVPLHPSPSSSSTESIEEGNEFVSRYFIYHDNEVIFQTVTVSLLAEHALDNLHAYASNYC
jgi:hypothetical protein